MGTPRRVVIDDTDSRVRYSGQRWFQDHGSQDSAGNSGPTYNRTSHGTNSNDSLSFTFEGTSIAVVGTTNRAHLDNGTRWDPSWECFVDKISIGATTAPLFEENNWTLCGKGVLNDGQHEITINITSTGQTFWLDYLTYIPSPKTSYDEAVLLVENDDPAIFLESGWEALGGSANMTTLKGSQAAFEFVGKSVTWVGYVPTELAHAPASGYFTIDGGSPISFTLNGLPADATTAVYKQAFFTTPDLIAGPHTLIVTYNGSNGPATPLTLDYLFLTNTSTPNTSTPNPSSAGSTSASTGTSNPSNGTTSSKTPVAAIVDGVIGGLALTALALTTLILFLFWWRRRHRVVHVKSVPEPSSRSNGTSPFEVTPFMSTYASRDPASYSYSKTRPPAHGTSQNQPYSAQNYGQEATPAAPTAVTSVLHQDSGVRLPQPNVIVEDIPPLYTAT